MQLLKYRHFTHNPAINCERLIYSTILNLRPDSSSSYKRDVEVVIWPDMLHLFIFAL